DSQQDAPGGFLDLFGKPPRESVCECERGETMMFGAVLNLVNGPTVADAIKDPNNRVASLLKKEKDTKKVVEDIYLSVLCRFPTKKELDDGVKAIKEGEEDYADWVADSKKRQAALATYEKTIPTKMVAWEKGLQVKPEWQNVEIVTMKA